eukprot:1242390-Rhodomonas_salina.1
MRTSGTLTSTAQVTASGVRQAPLRPTLTFSESVTSWQVWYETPFRDLPFDFAWTADYLQGPTKQPDRRPDGVAWHEQSGSLYFLEFTRAWDDSDSLQVAEDCKAERYEAAEAATRRSAQWNSKIQSVDTLPFVFCVLGSVQYKTLRENLLALD